MASALTYLALIFAAVQLATAAKISLEYSDCMDDVEDTKKLFDNAMLSYWNQVSSYQNRHADAFVKALEGMKKKGGDCMEKSMADKEAMEYVYLGSQPCKVFPLKKDYVAPWANNQKVSDKEACLFISTKGRIAIKLGRNNLNMIRSCQGIKWFQDTYVKMNEQCKKA